MKIVGGKHRGKKLGSFNNDDLRPTATRIKESIFNILTHGCENFFFHNTRVFDLFCGSGALGFEALSRGAKHSTFLDVSSRSLNLVKENAKAIGERENIKTLRIDLKSSTLLKRIVKYQVDLAFLDAPYNKNLTLPALVGLRDSLLLKKGAYLVVELSKGENLKLPEEYEIVNFRHYGSTSVLFLNYIV